MRKLIPIAIVSLLWLNLSTVARADGMLLPQPEALSPDYLAVRYHHVTVQIEDGHAVTRVDQEFYNPHSISVVGRYLFPVPPGAILSGFQVTVDGQRQTVTRQDAAQTNAALYPIIAQRHDPSLLQYADWESLALDLNLPPGGSRRMQLKYEEVLAPAGGLYHYRYILSTERYSSQPLEEVSLTIDLRSSPRLAALYSSSHQVTTERLGSDRARVSWRAQGVNPGEDFDLYFGSADRGFGGGFLTGQRNGQDHFLFLFSPEAETQAGDYLPKDVVFVLDRSGSMGGDKIDQAHNALSFVLGQLGAGDRFSIVGFDDQVSVLSHTLLPVGPDSLSDARRFAATLTARGNTDLAAALQAGLDILARSDRRDAPQIVVFLTDGLPTAGVTGEAEIARLANAANGRLAAPARLHVFGVGYDVNTHLLDRLAADNGGMVTYVQPGENLEAILTGFYAQIANPVLTGLQVEFQEVGADGVRPLETRDLYPQALPDLFQGSSLLLTGRCQATGQIVTATVRGRAGGQVREYTYTFDLSEAGGHDFVPRLWATRRVGALLDRVRVEGETEALVAEIRELGLSYGLVTPYTTFIITGQAIGAASTANMNLYNRSGLNDASGQVTIQARVQNQAYQQASQANLASGANVVNWGHHSLAQVGTQSVDLGLMQGRTLDGPITAGWISANISADRTIQFGSEEYFALARDPAARPFLQSGSNVIFSFQGQVIAVTDSGYQASGAGQTSHQPDSPDSLAPNRIAARAAAGASVPVVRWAVLGAMLLFGLLAASILGGVVVVVIYRAQRDKSRIVQ
jgi:Ca-activated chloride channel family protein